MEKQYTPEKEKKVAKNQTPKPIPEAKQDIQESKEGKKQEEKEQQEKIEKKQKKDAEQKKPKEKAFTSGVLRISHKHSMAICRMIKNKTPERAVEILSQVLKHKRAVPMRGEIPHRKGNIMSGRYPKNASEEFIILLKQVNANASVNGINNPVIAIAKADRANRPYRREGRRAKRTYVYLEVKNRIEKEQKENQLNKGKSAAEKP